MENIPSALFHIQKEITMVKSVSGLWHFKLKNSDNPAQSKGQDLCQESTSISGIVTGGLCDLQWRATPLFLQPLLVQRERIAFCYAPKRLTRGQSALLYKIKRQGQNKGKPLGLQFCVGSIQLSPSAKYH